MKYRAPDGEYRPGLVLTRRIGQIISIEHGLLEIQVVEISGKQIKLKFIGNVKVDRKEKLEAEALPVSD